MKSFSRPLFHLLNLFWKIVRKFWVRKKNYISAGTFLRYWVTSALVHVLSTTVSDQTKEIKLVLKSRQKDVENVVQWTTIVDKKAIEQNLIDFYFIKKHLSSLLLEGKWKFKQITVKCWKTFINTSKMSSNICTWRYKWNLKQSAGLGRDSNVQKRNNIIKSNLNGWHSKSPILL